MKSLMNCIRCKEIAYFAFILKIISLRKRVQASCAKIEIFLINPYLGTTEIDSLDLTISELACLEMSNTLDSL